MTNEYYMTLGAIQSLIHRLSTTDRAVLSTAGKAKIDPVIQQLKHLHEHLLQGGEAFAAADRQFRKVVDAAAQDLQVSAFDLNEGFESLAGLEEQISALQSMFYQMAVAVLPHLPIYTPLTNPTEPPPSSGSDG